MQGPMTPGRFADRLAVRHYALEMASFGPAGKGPLLVLCSTSMELGKPPRTTGLVSPTVHAHFFVPIERVSEISLQAKPFDPCGHFTVSQRRPLSNVIC